jgi:hypothetical protein
MKRTLTFLLLSLLFCSIEATAQERDYFYYALKKFDWSMQSSGIYQFQYSDKTDKGTPLDFILVNTLTKKHLFPIYTYDKKGRKELKKQVGNYELVFWWNCVFLKSSDGYAPCFDGLVWIVPEEDGLGNKCVTKGKLVFCNNEPRPSGIYKIAENDVFTPLLFDWEAPIYPLGTLPYIAMYKDGKTTLYNDQFQPVKTIDGEVTADWSYVYITKPDGTKEVFDNNFTPLPQLPSNWKGLYRYAGNYIVWISVDKQSVKVFNRENHLQWEESGQPVAFCEGKGVYEHYLRIGTSGQQGIRLLDGTWAIPVSDMTPSDEELSHCENWSYRQFVANFVAKKGEFETTAHFNERKADPALQEAYIAQSGLPEKFVSQFPGYALILSPYDADAQTFTLIPNAAHWNRLTIHIPLEEAEAFKNAFMDIRDEAVKNAKFCIRGDSISIEKITFTTPDSKTYTFEF